MTIVVGAPYSSEPVKHTDNLLFVRNRNLCFKFLNLRNVVVAVVGRV